MLCKKDGSSANVAFGPLGRNSPIFAWQLVCELSLLFLFNVFSDVDGDGDNNDQSADDVLQVWVDSDKGQTVVDDLQDQRSDNDSGNRTYSSGKGHATDNTCRNGVQVIV